MRLVLNPQRSTSAYPGAGTKGLCPQPANSLSSPLLVTFSVKLLYSFSLVTRTFAVIFQHSKSGVKYSEQQIFKKVVSSVLVLGGLRSLWYIFDAKKASE